MLHRLLKDLRIKFPQLTHLYLLGNLFCPEGEPGVAQEEAYEKLRALVTMSLPELQVLDGRTTDWVCSDCVMNYSCSCPVSWRTYSMCTHMHGPTDSSKSIVVLVQ